MLHFSGVSTSARRAYIAVFMNEPDMLRRSAEGALRSGLLKGRLCYKPS